ncbi:MAG: hypothetical protein J4G10_05425 [Alphaproteobacteria bacterium]|nr:hypothetical protein [Alphaproteobacteria bacterium]
MVKTFDKIAGQDPFNLSLSLLEAYHRVGLLVVPVEPSDERIEAGVLAGAPSAQLAERIYRAMTQLVD